MNRKIPFAAALIIFTLEACTAAVNELHPVNGIDSVKIIYLVSHGWHAGIVLKQADVPNTLWPESKAFSDARYLEVGWGDKDYYQTPTPHLGIAIKAILWPTPSVLHIVGFNEAVRSYFPGNEVIEISLSDDGFKRMIRYIAASHAKSSNGISKPIAQGLYGNSQFYLSGESYHVFKTCNVWTAQALRVAGCSFSSDFTITVEGLMSQVRRFGTVNRKGCVSLEKAKQDMGGIEK